MKTYEPLEDRVLVKPHKPTGEVKTEGGIIVTGIGKKQTMEATVLAIGPGTVARETGVQIPTVLNPGDLVLIPCEDDKPYGMEVNTGTEKDLRVMREGDILFRIKKSSENQGNS